MLTLKAIVDAANYELGYQSGDTIPDEVKAAVLGYVTAALQTMQTAGEEYYAKEEVDVSLVDGTASYALEKSVQSVLESPRIGSKSLMRLTSRSRYDNFGPLFLGQTSRTVAKGAPLAYFVESLRDTTAGEGDSVKLRIYLAPTPNSAVTLVVPVINEPPTYEVTDIDDESLIPPVPHKYHESILMPLVRMLTASHQNFDRNKERLPLIEREYQAAMVMLGLAKPTREKAPKEVAG